MPKMLHLISLVAALGTSAVLLFLAWHDLRRRQLPNRLVAIAGAGYFLFALERPAGIVLHVAVGLGFMTLGLLLTARGVMGGGDTKLIGVVMCWAGPERCLPALVIVTQAGLVLALLGLAARALLQHNPHRRTRPMLRCLTVARGVPYGVALALGGLAVIAAQNG